MNVESIFVCECVYIKDLCFGNFGKFLESIIVVVFEFVFSKIIEFCSVDSEINRGNVIDECDGKLLLVLGKVWVCVVRVVCIESNKLKYYGLNN